MIDKEVKHPKVLSFKMDKTLGAPVNYRDSWRIFRIISEVVEGYQFLINLEREVTIMGSARLAPNTKYYKIAEQLGRLLAKHNFTTLTGGGPGIMEAGNKGAFEAGGKSVGLNIELPFEQHINAYVNRSIGFYYFFTRKIMLTSPANAFVFFPGGFGTMDEFFEVVDYMELGLMERAPIVLVGREFWEPLLKFLRQQCAGSIKAVAEQEINNWHVVDTAAEAFEYIKDAADRPNSCTLDSTSPFCQIGTEWNIFRIMAELVNGFELLTKISNDITVFGTQTILPGHQYYEAAYQVGKIFAQNQFTTITGGGPGVQEAANKGAYENGGESIGLDIRIHDKERLNNYVTKSMGFFFPFVRKLIITAPSKAFVCFPGGFGTLHQLFELLTLQETKKINPIPTIVYGREFWQPLLDFIHLLYNDFKTISQSDEDFITVIDRPEDVLLYLDASAQYSLT
jgi:uncharacterized protein (TIGR00730 family)